MDPERRVRLVDAGGSPPARPHLPPASPAVGNGKLALQSRHEDSTTVAAAADLAKVQLDLQRAESRLKESKEKAANAAEVSNRIIRSLRVLRESDATSAHLGLKSELVAAKESNLSLKTELVNTKKDLTHHTSLLRLTREQLHKRVGEKDALLQESRAELAGTQAVLLQTTHKVTHSPYPSLTNLAGH